MKTVAIIAQKGGSGKTTLCVHMAVCAIRHKLKAAIIDIDPQSSAYKWNQSRPDKLKLDAITATSGQIAAYLQQAETGGIDFVIIDTAPHSSSAVTVAVQLVDFVLIPCRPARFDLDTMLSTTQIPFLSKKPFAIVLNGAPRGKIVIEARKTLENQGFRVLDPVLYQRSAYGHAVIDGRSVHEYEPKGKATQEIEEIFNHITRLYGITKRRGRKND